MAEPSCSAADRDSFNNSGAFDDRFGNWGSAPPNIVPHPRPIVRNLSTIVLETGVRRRQDASEIPGLRFCVRWKNIAVQRFPMVRFGSGSRCVLGSAFVSAE